MPVGRLLPLGAHVVVGDDGDVLELVGEACARLHLAGGGVELMGEAQDFFHFGSLGCAGLIEDGTVVDLGAGESATPAGFVEGKGLITYGEEAREAERVGEGVDTGREGAIGPGGVVVGDAAGAEVRAEDAHELRGEQIGDVSAVVKGRVHNNEVEALIGMTNEPTAAVVDDDVHLGIGEQARDFRVAGDERQVAGIDLNNGEIFHAGTVDDDLSPGAGGEADHEDMFRGGMHTGNGKGAEEAVGVVHHVDVETAVVDSTAEESASGIGEFGGVGIDGNHTAAVLQHLRELFGGIPGGFEEQALVHAGKQIRRAEGQCQANRTTGGDGEFADFGAGEKGQDQRDQDTQAEKQQRGGACRPVVEDDKADDEAAERGTDDVAEVKEADAFADAGFGIDGGVREQREGRAEQGCSNKDERVGWAIGEMHDPSGEGGAEQEGGNGAKQHNLGCGGHGALNVVAELFAAGIADGDGAIGDAEEVEGQHFSESGREAAGRVGVEAIPDDFVSEGDEAGGTGEDHSDP